MDQMTTYTENEAVLNIGDLFKIFWKHLWLIVLAAAIAFGGCFAYRYVTYTEEYTSTAQLFVLNSEALEDATTPSAYSYYYALALSIVEDCSELLLSDTVLNNVIDELGLDIAPSVLRRMVKVSFTDTSRIIKVSVTTGNPELSYEIVNSLCVHGAERIDIITGGNQASVFEYGKVSQMPSNNVDIILPMAAGFGAALLVYAVFFILARLDDKIHGVEDIEQHLGLTVLGDIPSKSDNVGRGKKYGRRLYGRYGSYGDAGTKPSNGQ